WVRVQNLCTTGTTGEIRARVRFNIAGKGKEQNCETSLEHLDMLIIGLRKVYQRDAKCWDGIEQYKYQLTSEKYGSKALRLLRALAIIIACNRLQVGLDQRAWQILCTNTIVTPDSTNKNYAEVDVIMNFLDMSALKPALINIIRNVVMFGKDPSWMFCLPLLHFASKLCEPFEEMSKDLNHGERSQIWWGVADIEAEVTAFQKNCSNWILPLKDIFHTLRPLFEVDYYLPRSIVASLTVEEVAFVIDHQVFPVEVCCAALLHWMKATYPDYYRHYAYTDLEDERPGGEQCVSSYSKLGSKGSKNESDVKNAIDTVGSKVLDWLQIYANSLWGVWESAMIDSNDDFAVNWNERITWNLQQRIEGELGTHSNLKKDFIRFYCADVEKFNGTMKSCVTNIASKAIEGGYMIEYMHMGSSEKKKFGDLLSDWFRKEWRTVITSGPLEAKDMRIFKMAISLLPIQLFVQNQNGFSETLSLIRRKEKGLKAKVLSTIRIRMLELEAFKIQSRQMTVFVNHCQHLNSVDTRIIDEVQQKAFELEKHSLREFCKPMVVNDFGETIGPDLIAFDVEPDVLDILPLLERLAEGFVFKRIWRETCSSTTERCKTPLDVVNVVWDAAFERWNEFRKHLETGELSFADAEKMFRKFKTEDEKLLQEMQDLKISRQKAIKRIKQIKQNRQLSGCAEGAKVILKIQQQYCLHGDFQAIKTIASHYEGNFKLRDFDDNLIEISEILKDITKKESDCLDAFVKCAKLMFVDLAMMYAGEEPMYIYMVQCLHSAVLGYSPLIFELDERECNYRRLLEMCKLVWKELAKNRNLTKQLLDSNGNLEWLKDIKKAHVSVEVTSLMQTEAINAWGIYTVGRGACKGSELSDMTVKDTIKLTVPANDRQSQLKSYTFDQLQDLKSQLILVAGKPDYSTVKPTNKKSEVNVDRFTMIFDSMTRLCSVYLKLCSSGCVLFNNMNANFHCSLVQERQLCAILEFGKGKDAPKFEGRKSDTEGLEDMVPKIVDFMKKCYGEWLDFIKQKRKIYLFLNYFTIDQLVILQRELVKMGTDEGPSLRTYNLLSAVKENCTLENVELAMEKAKRELPVPDDKPKEAPDALENEEEIGALEDVKMARFVRELVEAGCDETIARKSVDHVNQEDIDLCDVTDAMIWCLNQTGEENENGEMNQYDVEDTTYVNRRNAGVKPLINDLKELWNNFLGSISSSISDYISLEHLGVILNMLAEKALSIFMYDPDQHLPQSDEVLMCTSDTTVDEVSIFLRRAIYDSSDKIHCLLHADLLDIDVSEAAEQCLDELLSDIRQSSDIKYRLFVICGSDNKYHSTIVSSLEKSTVRVIKSTRVGVGKTLFVQRKDKAVQAMIHRKYKSVDTQRVSIPLQEKVINLHSFIQSLLEHTPDPRKLSARIFHLNMNHEVQEGVDYVLFNLLILNCLVDKSGYVWRRSDKETFFVHQVFTFLPDSTCRSPVESLQIYSDRNTVQDYMPTDQLFDEQQFQSPVYQRTFQYLLGWDQQQTFDSIIPLEPKGDPKTCLLVLLRYCGVRDPSWSELHHFVWFLNTQLVDFEQNQFVSVAAAEDLPGFATFVLRFLIQMSRDFSTRSVNMSEESLGVIPQSAMNTLDEKELELYQMRRTWESSPHSYLFFNSDRLTFTFLGFNIDRNTGNLVDQQTDRILEQRIMDQPLYDSLVRNNVPIREDFDALPRDQKILMLCRFMGIVIPHDPDSTCDIPVIIMGETGCGKTRLVKFMCALQSPPGVHEKNLILMKVHEGTTNEDIKRRVNEAKYTARVNKTYDRHIYTILFFDEANTTEAIRLIQEIMCDKSIAGKPLNLCKKIKIVAACNPYRKHSDEYIKRLEQAELGYHVDADGAIDRLGRVPMKRLVYRVQPLPQSLLPLVWDFGQLNTQVEELYIRQMVRRYINDDRLPNIPNLIEVVTDILTVSQDFMRAQRDECSFVSLRDVERVLTVMAWFFYQIKDGGWLSAKIDGKVVGCEDQRQDDSEKEEGLTDITRALILALGVCYHACLSTKHEYRQVIAGHFHQPCSLQGGEAQILEVIERNTALKENVFMMVVCIELRIPLFLIGKPGSSKSLAKTIVADAMQGKHSKQELFRLMKQVQMVSFQCSPLSTPGGIVETFRHCAQFQKDKDLQTFVSTVVLDEVGLAKDSPIMPLKTLHSLLENGCLGDEKQEPFKKVAFLGISNWALDPAKMNRGIIVQREIPNLEELQNSARGICGGSEDLGHLIEYLIEPLSKSYLEVFAQATQENREFFGLRDFYSLVKMLYNFVEKSHLPPTWYQILHAILRNFGGCDQVNPENIFTKHLESVISCSSKKLLQTKDNEIRPITIFGSSFRSDQGYTQVCRNINKIKVCMETGNTVVLLNLDNLYESLYDALNQNYVYFGGERYVDLGLGTHRVKCPVHKKFRLILIAEKQTVYNKFPIPLINRVEKHFLTVKTILNDKQQRLVSDLEKWAIDFASEKYDNSFTGRNTKRQLKVEDIFIGYHRDTCSAIILDVTQKYQNAQDGEKPANCCYYGVPRLRVLSGVTTHSKLLASSHKQDISSEIGIDVGRIFLLETLSSIDTEQQFTNRVQQHLQTAKTDESLMLIQCDSGDVNENLIACARYFVIDEYEKAREHLRAPVHVIFIVQVPRKAGGCFTGIQFDRWHSAHIDDLYPVNTEMPVIQDLHGENISSIFLTMVKKHSSHDEIEGKQVEEMNWTENGTRGTQPCDQERRTGGRRKATVDEMDNAAQLNTQVPAVDKEQQRQDLSKVNGLIMQCVQSALAIVKDKEGYTQRETHRVDIVLKCLRHAKNLEHGADSFLTGLQRMIGQLFKEKEEIMGDNIAKMWMIRDAAVAENISKAGTFRRSCHQTIISWVSPILAGIIAYLDTNRNLDLVQKYEDQQSREVGEQRRKVASCAKIVAASPIGKILNQLVEGIQGASVEQTHAFVFEIVQEYVQDFVHMMYYPGCEDEFKIVCQTVHYKTMDICEVTNSMGCLIETLTCVHIAYESLALRHAYFRSMNEVWPQCSSAILEVKKTNPDHFMFKEREFTFSALCLLIENLNPKLQDLNEEVQREKWLLKVYLYRSVVEKVLNMHSENPALHGIDSAQSVRRAKSTWSRVIVMKLFIEHVCIKNARESVTIKYCMPLWKKFLKMCNQNALKLFYGAEITCCYCERKLQGVPVTLPCMKRDVLCDPCLREISALDQNECPKCQENLGLQWQPMHMEEESEEREQFIQYQKMCNAFFKDVVAQLCFSDGQPPSRNVLEKLLGYVTCSANESNLQFTKNLTVFETGLDPNPVFRSFLVHEKEFVKESLRGYIEQAHEFIRKEPAQEHNLVDLSLLIIQCFENTLLLQWHTQHLHCWSYISDLLETARDGLVNKKLTTDQLYCIARARVGLSQAASLIADMINTGTELSTEQRNVINSARRVCTISHLKWPRIFLVKHLCRCYGINVYQSICRHRTTLLKWIVIEELERDQTQDVSDRYVVCGDGYIKIREALSQVILGKNISTLKNKIQELRATGWHTDICLQLAVHRVITCSYVHSLESRTATPKSLKNIASFLDTTENQRNKLLRIMMNNTLEPQQLVTVHGSDTISQGIQCLVVHFMTVLPQLNGDKTLLHLFLAMIQGDQAIRGMFLPTMPEYNFAEVEEAMLGSRGPNIYGCPNRHQYVIGNCGRPDVVGTFTTSGADFGGHSYHAMPGNIVYTGGDNKLSGHILGRAVPNAPLRPEREMSALHCCVIRLLLHMSMFLGPSEQIVPIVHPDIEKDNIRQFFWEHIGINIGDIQRYLGRSVDDVLLLMHNVIQNIMVKHAIGFTVDVDISLLRTIQGKQAWEKQFATVFLQDVFQRLDHHLEHFNQTDTQQQAEDPQRPEEIPRVWSYRTPISIEHMRQDLETAGKDTLSVLRMFLKQDHILQAMQFIPSILSLQRILLRKFQKKLDKGEANAILVKDMIKEQLAGPDTEKLLQDFGHAWNITRRLLESYVCTTQFESIVVPKNQCDAPVSMETPLSVFLPTTTGSGLGSYAMLDLLFRKQNEFLDSYMKESDRRSTSIQTVTPREITSAHLISYNHEQDILPLLLASCQYTFEMGQGIKKEYDFVGLERQIIDRFLFSKSRIDMGHYLKIDQMVYRTKFTNGAVFEQLDEKIQQQTLGPAVKIQICDEIKSLPDVCLFLDTLDIAIGFLKTTGGKQSENLNAFIVETLQIEQAMTSRKARQSCEFQHAKSLWLLLSHLKSKFMVDNLHSKQAW
ncbi:R213A-like protein, partial [Mya arenaria]